MVVNLVLEREAKLSPYSIGSDLSTGKIFGSQGDGGTTIHINKRKVTVGNTEGRINNGNKCGQNGIRIRT